MILLLTSLAFIITIWLVGILPFKYAIVLSALIAVIAAIILFFLIRSGKGALRTFLIVDTLMISAILCLGSYLLMETSGFVNKISVVKETADFYVVARANSDKNSIEDLSGETVVVPAHQDIMDEKAEAELKNKTDVTIEMAGTSFKLCNELLKGSRDIIMLNSAYYDSAIEEIDDFNEESVKIIAKISVAKDSSSETKKTTEGTEPFNVYITGIDTSGPISNVSRSDVNMIVTVNPKTKQVHLTSIPRDYYVELATVGQMDKLTHSGLMGPDVTVQTAENLLGIDINYYLKVNFSTVTTAVDFLGGTEYAFTTGGYEFTEGINHMDGAKALAFARERYSFSNGDRQRVRNQQAVIKAIIDKAASSPSILLRYNTILDSLDDNMQTNMDSAKIKELVRMQLDDMAKWDVSTFSMDGSGLMTTTYYYPSMEIYVMVPYQETVDEAKAKIDEVMMAGEQ